MAQSASGTGAGSAAAVNAGALRATQFSTVRKGFDPSEVTAPVSYTHLTLPTICSV